VSNRADFAVTESSCSNYSASKRVNNPLVSKTDAQCRDFAAHFLEDGGTSPKVHWIAGGSRARGDYDPVRYRSIGAVPIRLAASDPPWGVVVATSSRPGHFAGKNKLGGVQPEEDIRALAGMVALAIAVKQPIDGEKVTN